MALCAPIPPLTCVALLLDVGLGLEGVHVVCQRDLCPTLCGPPAGTRVSGGYVHVDCILRVDAIVCVLVLQMRKGILLCDEKEEGRERRCPASRGIKSNCTSSLHTPSYLLTPKRKPPTPGLASPKTHPPHLFQLHREDAEGAAGVGGGQDSKHRVGGVPLQNGPILEGEDGAGGGALNAVVLRQLGLDQALAVCALRRRPSVEGREVDRDNPWVVLWAHQAMHGRPVVFCPAPCPSFPRPCQASTPSPSLQGIDGVTVPKQQDAGAVDAHLLPLPCRWIRKSWFTQALGAVFLRQGLRHTPCLPARSVMNAPWVSIRPMHSPLGRSSGAIAGVKLPEAVDEEA